MKPREMNLVRARLLYQVVCFAGLIAPVSAADWPQWRGPQRNGISQETGLLKEWPKDGPKLLWQVKDIGDGYSTPAVVGDRLYALGNKGVDEEFVHALAVSDGKEIWKTPIGKVGNPDPHWALMAIWCAWKLQPARCAGEKAFAPTSTASPANGPIPNRR
jgi:hypothetical protein